MRNYVDFLEALLFSAVLLASPAFGQPDAPQSARTALDAVSVKLDRSEIAKVEILEIPANVSTRERITPTLLEAHYFYRLTIQDIRDQTYLRNFTAAFKSVKIKSAGQGGDLRWGIIFYAIDGSRVAALYFDRWGTGGWVDNVPVVFGGNMIFRGDMIPWLERRFGHCFEN